MDTRHVILCLFPFQYLNESWQDTFTEGNYRLIFGLALDVLLRPWEKYVITLKFSEVSFNTTDLAIRNFIFS